MTALSSPAGTHSPQLTAGSQSGTVGDDAWRSNVRRAVLDEVADFVGTRCSVELNGAGLDAAGNTLVEFVSGGKCLRSAFMYVGWLCGAEPSNAALRAAASLELLHAFALLQDDVMDQSSKRRGRPAAHVQLTQSYRERGLSGSAERFGESAAILLGDLCLIWAEQMLRESGVEGRRLQQLWPRYDAMRIELAVGQFADLASDVRDLPPLDAVLDVARRKSGNYTVRRPLEIGAAMAGCDDRAVSQLGRYGAAVGEAFQLRDDMLGVFGSSANTGKPSGGDLLERKATSVVVMAYQMADAPTRRQLVELMNSEDLDDDMLDRFRTLIVATGAAQSIEDMIDHRVEYARNSLDDKVIDDSSRAALGNMAAACVERSA
ncbi:Geranylgeranyl pyrophosphate synthase [Mycobacterium numidiamassiliense]|uniref:Geranylgeranyl pyrophosphate synthase n=1 Tax=Mycobacterium numidiamassiliense TaxID=1841861 RepID=A0A2U3P842_9MYCO|nr:polyprenyl synthetase family protein [Mycobacterium numidiamassiliense]SPM39933.1 Geranylgeranyl pyrophosphate synthase [Mycobacterium numidiamassiliense]